MSKTARLDVAFNLAIVPGTRGAVYPDDGSGNIDYANALTSRLLLRPPAAVLDAWGQRPWGLQRWGLGYGERGWGASVWGQNPWGRWQDTVSISFKIPAALVTAGGPFLFELLVFTAAGLSIAGLYQTTIDVDPASPSGTITIA